MSCLAGFGVVLRRWRGGERCDTHKKTPGAQRHRAILSQTQLPRIRPAKVVTLLGRRGQAEAEDAFRDRSDAVIVRLAGARANAEGLFVILKANG